MGEMNDPEGPILNLQATVKLPMWLVRLAFEKSNRNIDEALIEHCTCPRNGPRRARPRAATLVERSPQYANINNLIHYLKDRIELTGPDLAVRPTVETELLRRRKLAVEARTRGKESAKLFIAEGRLYFMGAGLVRAGLAICPRCMTSFEVSWEQEPRSCSTCGSPLLLRKSSGCTIGDFAREENGAFNNRMADHVRATINPSFRWSDVKKG